VERFLPIFGLVRILFSSEIKTDVQIAGIFRAATWHAAASQE
jgi:hypothetical protein